MLNPGPFSINILASATPMRIQGHHDYLPLAGKRAEKMEGHPRKGFISQALKLQIILPPTLHSLQLSHMAHLTAGEAGKCIL